MVDSWHVLSRFSSVTGRLLLSGTWLGNEFAYIHDSVGQFMGLHAAARASIVRASLPR